jgi:ubiquinone/menaquinone biosynthesis C-methylase UbiE
MLLKNLRPAEEYDQFANSVLEPWDIMFIARIRHLARDLGKGTIADIGTATAVVPLRLAKESVMDGWRIIGIDLDPDMLEQGRPLIRQLGLESRIELQVGDGQKLPLEDGSLMMVVSRATLHHYPDKAASLREMYRVLAPGGVGLVHDMRQDAPAAVLERFTRMRAEANYPPTHIEEKLTLVQAQALVEETGLGGCSTVSSPRIGLGAMGFEILIKKPLAAA